MAKSKFYAVAVGRVVGIFDSWAECEKQVKGFRGAKYKSFKTKAEAQEFINENGSSSNSMTAVVTTLIDSPNETTNNNHSSKRTSSPSALFDTSDVASKRPKMERAADVSILLSFDGGSRGNPGVAGCGTEVILSRTQLQEGFSTTKKILLRSKTRICRCLKGKQTNNVAEYWGLISGLECVRDILENEDKSQQKQRRVSLTIQGDSKLVIEQMKGAYKVGDTLQSTFRIAQARLRRIEDVCKRSSVTLDCTFEHIYRNGNKVADELANKAMDAQRSWSEHVDCDGISTTTEILDIDTRKTQHSSESARVVASNSQSSECVWV